ncbi:hypothetical protein HanIR_Chr15g0762861 [Helianthus annuus]|nr:hypothetical protein HanIR_Chr15g0762861 [Helianthus annuus]
MPMPRACMCEMTVLHPLYEPSRVWQTISYKHFKFCLSTYNGQRLIHFLPFMVVPTIQLRASIFHSS